MPRGRPPKPHAQAWLAGDPSKKRRYETEPEPLQGRPEPPDYLDPLARAEWDSITSLLADMGLLSRSDRVALEMYCNSYSRYRKAQEQVAKFGPVILSPNKKYPMQSPYANEMNACQEQIRKLLTEFGLTPAARARMSLPVKEQTKATGILKLCS